MALVNSSNWSPVQPINIKTKHDLLQELVYWEVVGKRHKQLCSLRKGLDYLGLLALCKKHPVELRHLFLYNNNLQIRSDELLRLFDFNVEPVLHVLDWFKEYIQLRAEEGSSKWVHVITNESVCMLVDN